MKRMTHRMLRQALLFMVDLLRYLTVTTMARMTRPPSIWFQLNLRLLRKVSVNGLSLYMLLILGLRTPAVGHEETSSTGCEER